jgi:hypothetical protein
MSATIFLTGLVNLPFGYWRASLKKLSFTWFLAIHLPIIFVMIFRFVFHLGFQLYTYPFLIAAFFFGQFIVARYYISHGEATRKK